MKRIGILTAGGDTPALNATIQGAVVRANQRRVEVYGFIKGFSSLLHPRVPHVHLNPLYCEIPELDPTRGGTLIGASRAYVDAQRHEEHGRDRPSPLAARHRGPHLRRRRWHPERAAAASPSASRPCSPPRPSTTTSASTTAASPRSGCASPRRRPPATTTTACPSRDVVRPRAASSTTRRPATPRRCSSRPRASGASAPRPRAIAASRSSR